MTVVSEIKAVQLAFNVITGLQLTSYMFPLSAYVPDKSAYDFIIIGGGTAGCVIANRLTENCNVNVLLIEAGDDPRLESNIPSLMLYLKGSQAAWNLEPDYAKHIPVQTEDKNLAQGKSIGGSSTSGFLFYSEGNQKDYNQWAAALNDSTWEWENVLPYFKKSQKLNDPVIKKSADGDLFGTEGNIGLTVYRSTTTETFIDAFSQIGHKYVPSFNGKVSLGVSESLFTIDNELRQSTGVSYISVIKHRPNLHILKNTKVTKILFDENNNAEGVEAYTEDKEYICIKAKKEVIVTAGIFNSPKLLLLSGIGPKKHLHDHHINTISDLPVGENLQTYPGVFLTFNMTKTVSPYKAWNPYKFPAAVVDLYASLNKCSDIPDYRAINYYNLPKDQIKYCAFTYSFNPKLCDALLKAHVNSVTMFSNIFFPNIIFRGQVRLRSKHFKVPPKIYIDNNLYNVEHAVEILKDFMKITKTDAFKELGAEFKNPLMKKCGEMCIDSSKYWECYFKEMNYPLYNYVGTCAMGSVVDPRLRVKGVQKLRVADSSVMMSHTTGDIMGPTVMIAEKAADMIKEDNNC